MLAFAILRWFGFGRVEETRELIRDASSFEQKVATSVLSKQALAYYTSASDGETAKHHANTAYQRILFRPRVLRKVRNVDPSTTFLGQKSSLPIFVRCVSTSWEEAKDDICIWY